MKNSFLLVSATIALLFLSGCPQSGLSTLQQPAEEKSKTVTVIFIADARGDTVLNLEVETEQGTNLFEILKEKADIGYQEFELGAFIDEIGGVKPGVNEYWALYVNDEYAEKGISDYTAEDGMIIEWKIESFEDFQG